MRRKFIPFSGVFSFLVISAVSVTRATSGDDADYSGLRSHPDAIRVINTHEHQHRPEELEKHNYNFFHGRFPRTGESATPGKQVVHQF